MAKFLLVGKCFISFLTLIMTANDDTVFGSVPLANTHNCDLMNAQITDMEPHISLGNESLCCNTSVKKRSFRDEDDICFWDNPCANIGVCKPRPDKPAGFICECYQQFYVGEECVMDKLQEKNYCDITTNFCLNGGTCKPVWGSYFCECSDEYEGRKCENRKDGKTFRRMSQPVFLYDIDAGTTNSCVFLLFFKNKNIGHNFTFTFYLRGIQVFHVKEEDMYFEVPAKWKTLLKSKHLSSKFIDDVTYMYHWKVEFFFVHLLLRASIKLFNNQRLQFEDDYIISVSRIPGKCIPDLKLKDCDSWKRRHEHVIRGTTDKNCIRLSSKLHYQWMVSGTENDIPHQSTFFFKIPKFSVKPGLYRLQLKVSEIVVKPGRWKSYYNTVNQEPASTVILPPPQNEGRSYYHFKA